LKEVISASTGKPTRIDDLYNYNNKYNDKKLGRKLGVTKIKMAPRPKGDSLGGYADTEIG
jgi:hypothetical protein